jgi:hypothetical protein
MRPDVLLQEARDWCRGRNWVIRAPLLAYFFYVLIRHVGDPLYSSIIGGLNLGIHELGHVVFGFLGQPLMIAGGTILQLAAPAFAVYNFYRQRDFFAIALSFGWLSTNFFNIATYIADARRLELPLVSIGGASVNHDWEYLLGSMNILPYDTAIAGFTRLIAVLTMLVCFISGTWVLWQMAQRPGKEGNDLQKSL